MSYCIHSVNEPLHQYNGLLLIHVSRESSYYKPTKWAWERERRGGSDGDAQFIQVHFATTAAISTTRRWHGFHRLLLCHSFFASCIHLFLCPTFQSCSEPINAWMNCALLWTWMKLVQHSIWCSTIDVIKICKTRNNWNLRKCIFEGCNQTHLLLFMSRSIRGVPHWMHYSKVQAYFLI